MEAIMDKSALYSLSYGLYVCGVRTENGFGGCVVDALAQVSSGAPPVLCLASMKENYTNELLRKYGEFTLSVLPQNVDPRVIASFGYRSARTIPNKWAAVAHTLRDGLPYLDGALAYMRCRVTDAKETETHTAFFAEVTDAWRGDTAAKPLLYAEYQSELKPAVSAAFKLLRAEQSAANAAPWVCKICGYAYDGETPFAELPDDWVCPLCGAGKDEFTRG
jgi:flavin reductase (DIM6/NTAB) family NADH-FMN oxidoreductase RutF/rubredoxin